MCIRDSLYCPIKLWIRGTFFLLKSICNLSFEIRGEKNINKKNIKFIASKHQSAFETLFLYNYFSKVIFIHKYELFFIPIFGMYLKKQWYSLELKEKPHQNLFHIINLDINLLHYYLLEPTLGIGDPRYDNRIDFLAGFHGLEGIEKKVDSGEAEVGFALFPTQIDNIISFADRKLNMPPKSTWFDPKPLDGLVAYDFE